MSVLYEYIKGEVVIIKDDFIVIDNNGIGYKIFTSSKSIKDVYVGKRVTMYINFNIREDGIYLYGFTSQEELDMFNLLQLVSKIGPRVSLNILSTLTPMQIKSAIIHNRPDILCNVPGVGKKTASRVILELKDRIDKEEISHHSRLIENEDNIEMAINGIMSLGYTRSEILNVMNKLDVEKMDTESIIRKS